MCMSFSTLPYIVILISANLTARAVAQVTTVHHAIGNLTEKNYLLNADEGNLFIPFIHAFIHWCRQWFHKISKIRFSLPLAKMWNRICATLKWLFINSIFSSSKKKKIWSKQVNARLKFWNFITSLFLSLSKMEINAWRATAFSDLLILHCMQPPFQFCLCQTFQSNIE